jgi:hypothetical protein
MATTIKTNKPAAKAKTSPAANKAAAKIAREGAILIDGKTTYRSFKLQRDKIDKEARTVPICFSSEDVGEQWFGREILDHSPGACDLGRLNNGGAYSANTTATIKSASLLPVAQKSKAINAAVAL